MNNDDPDTNDLLVAWARELAAKLDVNPAAVDIDAVLGLAGVVAHAVVRPAAPVSTYLAGVAVGAAISRGDDAGSAFLRAADVVRALAQRQPGGA